jgi:hypothetical protein
MNQVTFSNLHRISFDQSVPFWSQTSDWNSVESVRNVFDFFEKELASSANDAELFQSRARAILKDLIQARQASPELEVVSQFLQFYVASCVLRHLMGRKMLNYMHDWLCNSISEEVSQAISRDYFPNRVAAFPQAGHPFIQEFFEEAFLLWSQALFYYCRNVGGLNELAIRYTDIYFCLLQTSTRTGHFSIELIGSLSQIASWAEQHNRSQTVRDCCLLLSQIYDRTGDINNKKNIAFALSCLRNNYTPATKQQWCNLVLTQYNSKLVGHECLQVLLNKYEGDTQLINRNIDKIFRGIDIYHKYLDRLRIGGVAINYELAKIFMLFERTIYRLLLGGQVAFTNKLIGYYFRIPEGGVIEGQNFYLLPNDAEGVLYCFEGQVIHHPSDSSIHIPAITLASNQFLGIANTLNNLLGFQITAPQRVGVPDRTQAEAYYQAVIDHIDLRKLRYHPKITDCNGFYLYYGSQLPIQTIITRETGITFPLIQSFYKPMPAREIRKVLIWQGHTILSETQSAGVKEIFETEGVGVTVLVAAESSKEEFFDHYQCPDFDVIWIICHGEFNHYKPHASYLELGNDISVNLDELIYVPANLNQRRLMVLDACDGASTSLFNSPASIGLGANMVNAQQSLLSHFWPIYDYAGLILSILLAINLSRREDYRTAHSKTVLLFAKGKEAVLDFVRAECQNQDVLERIENTSLDFQNFYYWGSLGYLE